MSTPPNVVSALGRPPYVAALGAVTLLVVVWAAAAPRPARVIPGLHTDKVVQQLGEGTHRASQCPNGVAVPKL